MSSFFRKSSQSVPVVYRVVRCHLEKESITRIRFYRKNQGVTYISNTGHQATHYYTVSPAAPSSALPECKPENIRQMSAEGAAKPAYKATRLYPKTLAHLCHVLGDHVDDYPLLRIGRHSYKNLSLRERASCVEFMHCIKGVYHLSVHPNEKRATHRVPHNIWRHIRESGVRFLFRRRTCYIGHGSRCRRGSNIWPSYCFAPSEESNESDKYHSTELIRYIVQYELCHITHPIRIHMPKNSFPSRASLAASANSLFSKLTNPQVLPLARSS
eukprot:284815113_1